MIDFVKETKKHYIYVKVKGYKINNFIFNLTKLKIFVDKLNYIDKDNVSFKILKKDLVILKKAFPSYKIKVIKDAGIYTIKPKIQKNIIIIAGVIFGIFLLYFLSNIIVKVDVIHSNAEIRKLVRNELEDRGIKRLSLKKKYAELQKIKEEVLEKYPTRLEWLEIEVDGMNYIVRIEERIITKPTEEQAACHVISQKEGMITKIIAHKGENIRNVNQYVRKGDILISGYIKLNETIKDTVCAKGDIYAEVWYIVEVVVPLNYEEHILTGKTRKNILYETNKSKKSFLKSPFNNYDVNNKKIFSLFDTKFYLQTEKEYNIIPRTYTQEEAINKGIELAKEKITVKLNDNEYIISEKVLKKSLNDSKMEMEIFISVNELISKQEIFVPEIPQED